MSDFMVLSLVIAGVFQAITVVFLVAAFRNIRRAEIATAATREQLERPSFSRIVRCPKCGGIACTTDYELTELKPQ